MEEIRVICLDDGRFEVEQGSTMIRFNSKPDLLAAIDRNISAIEREIEEKIIAKNFENWSEEEEERHKIIDQNVNNGDHYEEIKDDWHSVYDDPYWFCESTCINPVENNKILGFTKEREYQLFKKRLMEELKVVSFELVEKEK